GNDDERPRADDLYPVRLGEANRQLSLHAEEHLVREVAVELLKPVLYSSADDARRIGVQPHVERVGAIEDPLTAGVFPRGKVVDIDHFPRHQIVLPFWIAAPLMRLSGERPSITAMDHSQSERELRRG